MPAAEDRGEVGRQRAGAGLRLAASILTVAPVPPGRTDRAVAGPAMLAAPAIGAGLGVVLAALVALAHWAFPGPGALLPAALTVIALAALTRGMHLDGLADTADGLGVYGDRDRALAVMKASDLGPFGAAAIVTVLLLDTAALAASIATGRGPLAIAVAVTAGRLTLPWACTPLTPSARPGGFGALMAGSTTAGQAAATTVIGVAAAAALGAASDGPGGATRAVVAIVAALAAAHGLRAHAVRRFGGITGDVFGALIETATTVALLVFAVRGG